jgi:hypothetical protein
MTASRSRFPIRQKNRRPVEENKAMKPDTEVVVEHIGGPWFLVAGEKIMGRQAAEARAEELRA